MKAAVVTEPGVLVITDVPSAGAARSRGDRAGRHVRHLRHRCACAGRRLWRRALSGDPWSRVRRHGDRSRSGSSRTRGRDAGRRRPDGLLRRVRDVPIGLDQHVHERRRPWHHRTRRTRRVCSGQRRPLRTASARAESRAGQSRRAAVVRPARARPARPGARRRHPRARVRSDRPAAHLACCRWPARRSTSSIATPTGLPSHRSSAPLASAASAAELASPNWSVIVDATGNPAAVRDAFAFARRTARIALLGVSGPGNSFPFEPFDIVARELTVLGRQLGAAYLRARRAAARVWPDPGAAAPRRRVAAQRNRRSVAPRACR